MRRTIFTSTIALGMLLPAQSAISQTKDANWQSLVGNDGSVTRIDLNSISHYGNGAADIVVYSVEGDSYNPENMRRLWFDCRGKYKDATGPGISSTMPLPPQSIAGKIGGIACIGSKDERLENIPQQTKDTPSQYCVGFSPEACGRIVAAAERGTKPAYCKSGSGLVGSGLSQEQTRICSVITNEELRKQSEPAQVQKVNNGRSYELTLSATKNKFPTIIGSTNLPDGTKLLVSIEKPRLVNARELLAAGLPMCENDCIPASGPKGEALGVAASVLARAFSAGPFSWAGKPFLRGNFRVDVFLVSLPGEDSNLPGNYERQLDRMKKPVFSQPVEIFP